MFDLNAFHEEVSQAADTIEESIDTEEDGVKKEEVLVF